MEKFNLNVFSVTSCHHAIQSSFSSFVGFGVNQNSIELIVNQMILIHSHAVQRQVKWTIHHCELPQSLSTLLFFFSFFFQWLFLSSDSVCPFVLTPRDTTWACVAKDSSDGALCFRLCGHLVLAHLISCNHCWLPQKMCVSV